MNRIKNPIQDTMLRRIGSPFSGHYSHDVSVSSSSFTTCFRCCHRRYHHDDYMMKRTTTATTMHGSHGLHLRQRPIMQLQKWITTPEHGPRLAQNRHFHSRHVLPLQQQQQALWQPLPRRAEMMSTTTTATRFNSSHPGNRTYTFFSTATSSPSTTTTSSIIQHPPPNHWHMAATVVGFVEESHKSMIGAPSTTWSDMVKKNMVCTSSGNDDKEHFYKPNHCLWRAIKTPGIIQT